MIWDQSDCLEVFYPTGSELTSSAAVARFNIPLAVT